MKTERLHLRITKDLKAKAQAAAEREHRTLSNYIINIINNDINREAVERYKKGQADEKHAKDL